MICFAMILVRVGNVCVMARHVSGSNFEAETCRRFSDSSFRSCPQFTFFTCLPFVHVVF